MRPKSALRVYPLRIGLFLPRLSSSPRDIPHQRFYSPADRPAIPAARNEADSRDNRMRGEARREMRRRERNVHTRAFTCTYTHARARAHTRIHGDENTEGKRKKAEREREAERRERSTRKKCAYGTKSRAPLSYQRACVRVVTGSPLRGFPHRFSNPRASSRRGLFREQPPPSPPPPPPPPPPPSLPAAPALRTRSVRARSPACGMQQMHLNANSRPGGAVHV